MSRTVAKTYTEYTDFYGSAPSPLCAQYGALLPDGCRVLDIGVGQGRNALPLARRGCLVTGIDTNADAIAQVRDKAAREGLAIDLYHTSFLDYQPDHPFDAVLCFGLLQTLSRREGASLVHRLRNWVRPGGALFMTAWHVDDPSFEKVSETWRPDGLHSFVGPDQQHRLYLARQEVFDLLLGWQTVHHWEGLGPPHAHPDGTKHCHGEVAAVAVRLTDRDG
jgi:2-polyprenyl-3-methyl-5-hydroxy-6-metoxy-1,4-benzoquinol methylase